MRKLFLLFITFSLVSIANGKDLNDIVRTQCSTCHGADGNTTSELYPIIAGQNQEYIANQLKAYRDKTRTNLNAQRFMQGIVSRLSDEDITNLAQYYATLKPEHKHQINDQVKYEIGRELFLKGNTDKGIPACAACHGEKALGNQSIPRLAGQNLNYLKRQFAVFHTNERPSASSTMQQFVKNLDEAEVNALAEYLQAQ